ncbi:MAG: DUF2062 domain-containing protein [Lentisphaeria bacterium]|nr:DUF2062 domain-containing protein [Lentisphaeria bacterium]
MKAACVIPHYNHPRTVLGIAAGARRHLTDVRVVDDGSTELPPDFEAELAKLGVALLKHDRNRGKGAAIRTAAAALDADGIDTMIVMDADGQHDPDDLPAFLAAAERDPDSIVIGCRDFEHAENVPGSSRFGRKFSNFWCRLETGIVCDDTQSGFRAYPVRAFRELHFHCSRYNFEIEVLVKLLWSGFHLIELPIGVVYEKPGRRITHFQPWKDNFLLSLLHAALVTRRLLPIPFKKLVKGPRRTSIWKILAHPVRFIKVLLAENADPAGLAASAAVGTLLAVLPLVGIHMAVILYCCIRLKLNKVMALAIQNLFMPPLSPFLCIELGYFLRHGRWWTEFTLQTCLSELHHRLLEWLLGSLILAPLFAALAWVIVYSLAGIVQRRSAA